MSRYDFSEGPPIGLNPEPREVTIRRGAGTRWTRCSCCHCPALLGVFAHTKRDDFDPKEHGHVFVCLACARRFGEAAKETP